MIHNASHKIFTTFRYELTEIIMYTKNSGYYTIFFILLKQNSSGFMSMIYRGTIHVYMHSVGTVLMDYLATYTTLLIIPVSIATVLQQQPCMLFYQLQKALHTACVQNVYTLYVRMPVYLARWCSKCFITKFLLVNTSQTYHNDQVCIHICINSYSRCL